MEEGSVRLNVQTTPLWLPALLEQRRVAADASISLGPADPSLLGRDGGPMSRRSVDSGSCHMGAGQPQADFRARFDKPGTARYNVMTCSQRWRHCSTDWTDSGPLGYGSTVCSEQPWVAVSKRAKHNLWTVRLVG